MTLIEASKVLYYCPSTIREICRSIGIRTRNHDLTDDEVSRIRDRIETEADYFSLRDIHSLLLSVTTLIGTKDFNNFVRSVFEAYCIHPVSASTRVGALYTPEDFHFLLRLFDQALPGWEKKDGGFKRMKKILEEQL